MVLTAAFGASETVETAARDSLVIASLAFPGYMVSVYALGRQSLRWIQIQGFFAMGLLYLCIGVLYYEVSGNRMALLTLYGLSFFFSNYGPNTTTFILPSLTYSRACRATMNGISAASGKVGALVGAMAFASALNAFSQQAIFLACAMLSFVGGLLTLCCVSGRVGYRDHDPDEDDSNTQEATDTTIMDLSLRDDRMISDTIAMKVVFSEPSLIDFAGM